jgi:hypothetical protein
MRYLASAVILALAVATPAAAQNVQGIAAQGPNAVGAARTAQITATITAIDKAKRAVTLKGPQGREKTIVAGPEVRNFDQLKIGDQVTVQYVEALVLELKKGSDPVVSRTDEVVGGAAKPGDKPGAAAGVNVTIVGEVMETNPATQTIVVRGPERVVEVKVEDPARFAKIAKGDKIQATYVEAAATGVTPVAAKK